MRRLWLAALAWPVVMAAGPVVSPELAEQMRAVIADFEAGRCAEVAPGAEQILKQAGVPEQARVGLGTMQIACLYDLKRAEEARAAALALSSGPGAAPLMENWFQAAMISRAWEDAELALARAIAIDPAHVRALDPGTMGDWLAGLDQAGEADRRSRLVALLGDVGFGGDDVEVRDSYMTGAVRAHLKAGRRDDAERVARQMVSRGALISLLTDREVAVLWPALEESAGEGMERSNRAALEAARNHAQAQGAAEASPRAAQARSGYVQALWDAGAREEALAEGARGLADAKTLAKAKEDAGWLVNLHAMLLAEAGRVDEADARFQALTELDIAERPWLISMRINRAMVLAEHGRAQTAVPLTDALGADAERYGTPFARQLVRWIAICARTRSGDRAGALAGLEGLLNHADDAPVATVRALLCLDDTDRAAARLVQILRHETRYRHAVKALQPPGVSGDPRDGNLRSLLDRPEVMAAYRQVGRDLPQALRPAGAAR